MYIRAFDAINLSILDFKPKKGVLYMIKGKPINLSILDFKHQKKDVYFDFFIL